MKNLLIAFEMLTSGESISIDTISVEGEIKEVVSLNGFGYENIILLKSAYEYLTKAISEYSELRREDPLELDNSKDIDKDEEDDDDDEIRDIEDQE